jgi:glycosyltransferase involved in cell wall biosynthesis
LRIIHFVEALKGGPATYLNELLPLQVKVHEDVVVFCPRDQAHLIKCPKVKVVPFDAVGRGLLGVFMLIKQWHNHLSENNYDIIHLHSTFAGLAGRISPAPKSAKVVYCPHGWSFGMTTTPLRKRAYELVEQVLSKRTDAIINISVHEEQLAVAARLPRSKFALIYNGLADAPWQPLEEGVRAHRLLFVGRYDRQKGVDILLEAFKELKPLGYDLTMIGGAVVGASTVEPELLGITNLGWRTPAEIRDALAKAHIVVMPSRWEGFSLVALEAMRAGRPVVAAAVSSLPEAIIDGETGALCAPESAPELVRAIVRLAEMPIDTIGTKARRLYEQRFTVEKMFLSLEEVYGSSGKNSLSEMSHLSEFATGS